MKEDGEGEGREILIQIRRVMKYMNYDYERALELPTDLFLLADRNALIEYYESTEDGRKHLERCKRLNTTTVDKEALRRRIRNEKKQ